mmetsp:Transcript_20792/g.57728  ORF Transcript_20792/g.57728 Transcript_20792/m.57728 type:complete len:472 (+) Transcript_20792:292-1707(+)
METCGRRVWIVSTAAPPCPTGTGLNPALRAGHLLARGVEVALVVPWLSAADQARVYPRGLVLHDQAAHHEFIRDWLEHRLSHRMRRLAVHSYDAFYDATLCSTLPKGDGNIARRLPHFPEDVTILEEPEHLNWFNQGRPWRRYFAHVVGILHTNYPEYFRRSGASEGLADFASRVNHWAVSRHCHKVIKLSDAIPGFPGSAACHVTGVSARFLSVGVAASASSFNRGAYFIGKAVWGKGYEELLHLVAARDASRAANGQGPLLMDVHVWGRGGPICNPGSSPEAGLQPGLPRGPGPPRPQADGVPGLCQPVHLGRAGHHHGGGSGHGEVGGRGKARVQQVLSEIPQLPGIRLPQLLRLHLQGHGHQARQAIAKVAEKPDVAGGYRAAPAGHAHSSRRVAGPFGPSRPQGDRGPCPLPQLCPVEEGRRLVARWPPLRHAQDPSTQHHSASISTKLSTSTKISSKRPTLSMDF